MFERLRAEAFRGFADSVDIDLNASVIIVHGPNGLGKTSLFDALQWVLVGELARLREARMRQSDEYIVNAYRPGQEAVVDVQLRLNGQQVRLVRRGNHSRSILTWISAEAGTLTGQEAEDLLARMFSGGTDLDLATSLNACGLLQQDATRDVLLSKPRDRYDTFSKILGLGELADIQQWARNNADAANTDFKNAEGQVAAAELETVQAEQRLSALRRTAAERPVLADVTARLHALVASSGFPHAVSLESRDEAAVATAAASTVAREAASLADDIRRLMAESASLGQADPVDTEAASARRIVATSSLEVVGIELAQARTELDRLQAAQESLATMASAVLPHVDGPSCPVCGQGVDEDDLRDRLRQLEEGLSTVDTQVRVANLARALAAAESELVLAANAEREGIAIALTRQRLQLDLERARERIAALLSPPALFGLSRQLDITEEASGRLDALADAASRVAAMGRELISAWDATATADETRAVSALAAATAQTDASLVRREGLAIAKSAAANLHEATRSARLEVVRREFARLGPLAQDIYSRLDPHPTFRDIDLVSEMYRSVGTTIAQVRDPVSDVAADPMLIFSSAQSNIAAISYLMALNLAASVGAPVLLLDDPLQAMDDVNVLGFADLCRHVRRQRQLFVSTHEKRFAVLLERKLAPRHPSDRTISIELVGWDRSGPVIKPRDVPDQIGSQSPAFATVA
ncbi:MAG: AAA family ATPase [Jatrophihabitantaceae bacterium]